MVQLSLTPHLKKGEGQAKKEKKDGFAIIEVLVSIVIIAILLITFEVLISHAIKVNRVNRYELKASLYLQEAIEVAKDLERSDWEALTCLTNCYPNVNSGVWELLAGQESLESGAYTRFLSIEDVCRNGDDEIVEGPCADPDPDTKKIVANINWNDSFRDRNLTLETYVYQY